MIQTEESRRYTYIIMDAERLIYQVALFGTLVTSSGPTIVRLVNVIRSCLCHPSSLECCNSHCRPSFDCRSRIQRWYPETLLHTAMIHLYMQRKCHLLNVFKLGIEIHLPRRLQPLSCHLTDLFSKRLVVPLFCRSNLLIISRSLLTGLWLVTDLSGWESDLNRSNPVNG